MASTNKTANLGLPQWEGTDTVEHGDFNGAFAKIDEFCGGQPWVKLLDIGFEEEKTSFTLDLSGISFDEYGMIVFFNKFATDGKQMRINGYSGNNYLYNVYGTTTVHRDYMVNDSTIDTFILGYNYLHVLHGEEFGRDALEKTYFDKLRNIYFFCSSNTMAYKPGDHIAVWGFRK